MTRHIKRVIQVQYTLYDVSEVVDQLSRGERAGTTDETTWDIHIQCPDTAVITLANLVWAKSCSTSTEESSCIDQIPILLVAGATIYLDALCPHMPVIGVINRPPYLKRDPDCVGAMKVWPLRRAVKLKAGEKRDIRTSTKVTRPLNKPGGLSHPNLLSRTVQRTNIERT